MSFTKNVSEILTLQTNIMLHISGSITFTLTYTGIAANFPTLAKYKVVWGDGSALSEGMLTLANQPQKISHVLADLNYFQASVTLDNVISTMTKNTQVSPHYFMIVASYHKIFFKSYV